jgi:RND family efflux transporter MFP subunit
VLTRGQLVAALDGAEIQQQVLQAEANLAVAEANLAEARSLWEISRREIERFNALREREFLSVSDHESAEARFLAQEAQLKVAEAQLRRQQAVLESTRIQQSYTEVRVNWTGTGEQRIVAERYHQVGDVVSPSQALFRIVEIDPIKAVIYVTERDYVFMQKGQAATLETDAFKGEVFKGTVERVSPVFRESTRQARVELSVQNNAYRLKPGMFVRVRLTLDRLESATLVPEIAIARRKEQTGVFIADPVAQTVSWHPVEVLFLDEGRCAVTPQTLSGLVVTLGQHLLEEGSKILIADSTIPSVREP